MQSTTTRGILGSSMPSASTITAAPFGLRIRRFRLCATTTLNCAEQCLDTMDSSAGILGPLLIVSAVALVSAGAAVHFFYLMPDYRDRLLAAGRGGLRSDSWAFQLRIWSHYLGSVWLLTMILFNYYKTITTQPGSPPLAPHHAHSPAFTANNPSTTESHNSSHESLVVAGSEGMESTDPSVPSIAIAVDATPPTTSGQRGVVVKVCGKCGRVKPERAHHCSICGKCVLRMDHHCPWMNNCVGHYNHRYFFLFMLYLWLTCVYCLIMGYPASMELFTNPKVPLVAGTDEVDMLRYHTQKLLLLIMMLCLALGFTLGGMLAWHTYMLCHNMTTLEFLARRSGGGQYQTDNVGYDVGLKSNLRQFFNLYNGRRWWTVLLPVSVPPVGDGTRFVSMNSPESFALLDRLNNDGDDKGE